MVESNERDKRILATNQLGEVGPISDERRRYLEEWVQDEEILTEQVLYQMGKERMDAAIAESDDPGSAFMEMFTGELPPIHQYRVPYDAGELMGVDERVASLTPELRTELRTRVEKHRDEIKESLQTGIEDTRKPLDSGRRAMFERRVREFRADDYPEEVPEIFYDGMCNVFGHICPVFFAAESITETSEERRRGRYIPFGVKMRVVRRDNYTCQHCGKHLQDDEVEFDHKIPISKGGSSEEHNIRLTCYDCNRDKSDKVEI